MTVHSGARWPTSATGHRLFSLLPVCAGTENPSKDSPISRRDPLLSFLKEKNTLPFHRTSTQKEQKSTRILLLPGYTEESSGNFSTTLPLALE